MMSIWNGEGRRVKKEERGVWDELEGKKEMKRERKKGRIQSGELERNLQLYLFQMVKGAWRVKKEERGVWMN